MAEWVAGETRGFPVDPITHHFQQIEHESLGTLEATEFVDEDQLVAKQVASARSILKSSQAILREDAAELWQGLAPRELFRSIQHMSREGLGAHRRGDGSEAARLARGILHRARAAEEWLQRRGSELHVQRVSDASEDADGYERHTVTEMTHSGTAATERVSMTQLEAFSDGASLCEIESQHSEPDPPVPMKTLENISQEEVQQYAANVRDEFGMSLLHLAAEKGWVAQASSLLHRGSAVDARSKRGRTPLHVAAMKGATSILQMLIDHGASVHSKDLTGLTPLHLAAMCGDAEAAQLLLDKGASVTCRDELFGRSPLHCAAHHGCSEVLKILTEGADLTAKDDDNKTAHDLAVQKGWKEVIQLLSC